MADTGIRCRCCGLLQKWVGNGLCNGCTYHQSREIHQEAKRHREHEEMLRERLTAATKWASDADAERKAFGEKMHWALRSRDRTIAILRKINDMHELHVDGSCKCGKVKHCRIGELLDDRGVQQLIRRVDEHEAEQQERERVWREIQASGDPDEWEGLIRGSGAFTPPRRGDGRADAVGSGA
jgi:hypothetical protein